ncbi:unnamed protein product [Amoebophrya sp. A120]|nr:unnamed protein product [Amoebophrya sp. A120]|eukprot:GSA120T00008062001.1
MMAPPPPAASGGPGGSLPPGAVGTTTNNSAGGASSSSTGPLPSSMTNIQLHQHQPNPATSKLPFDPTVLLDTTTPWGDDRVQLLDVMVEIMYSQSVEIIVKAMESGNLQIGGASSSSASSGQGGGAALGLPAHQINPGGASSFNPHTLTKQDQKQIVKFAHEILHQLKDRPDAWRLVDTILAKSQNPASKFFALNLLEECIKSKWRLPDLPREQIKAFVTDLLIKVSRNAEVVQREKQFVTKLSEVLVCIVRQDWPHNWPEFIPEIVGASKVDPTLCENNLKILAMLSEDVFDFGEKTMVSKRVLTLKTSLSQQFTQVFELCMFVFEVFVQQAPGTIKPSLVKTTLQTLSKFLSWIPLGYVFETDLIPILFNHFWDPIEFRMECILCLNEIAILTPESTPGLSSSSTTAIMSASAGVASATTASAQYRDKLLECFVATIRKIATTLPNGILDQVRAGDGFSTHMIQQCALLVTSFLKHHFEAVDERWDSLSTALNFLVEVTAVPDEEIFKLCVESWDLIAGRLYLHGEQSRNAWLREQNGNNIIPELQNDEMSMINGMLVRTQHRDSAQDVIRTELNDNKLKRFSPVLSRVRELLVLRMVKPPEVTIRENEEGHIVRQAEDDTDELALYKMMRGILVYLCHLNPEHMDKLMLEKLSQEAQLAHSMNSEPSPGPGGGGGQNPLRNRWSPGNLNRLCYAIGSVSGALSENHEKRFLVSVIKDLLALCDLKRGKENKAIVASNIMYVVGQYPSFLRAHWRFLKTVILKLIEFMHESFPGVQEMAVDTLLRITQKCKKKFVTTQPDAAEPFLVELLEMTKSNINDLDHLLITTYYESIGMMIGAARPVDREQYVEKLLSIFNDIFVNTIRHIQIDQGKSLCENIDELKRTALYLRLNERVAGTVGLAFTKQFRAVYSSSLQLYKLFSQYIGQKTAEMIQMHPNMSNSGANALKLANVRQMRTAKRATLRLVTTYLKKCSATALAAEQQADLNTFGPNDTTQQSQQLFLQLQQDPAALEQEVATFVVPPLLEPVLQDYQNGVPEARDAEVLDLLTTLVTQLGKPISTEMPRIFDMIVAPTLRMLESDMQSFPDHRIKLFDLLSAVNRDCFSSLFSLRDDMMRLYLNSLLWGMKHEHPVVSQTALQILSQFLQQVLKSLPPEASKPFFREFYALILNAVLGILTDTMHTSGLKHQVEIFLELVRGCHDASHDSTGAGPLGLGPGGFASTQQPGSGGLAALSLTNDPAASSSNLVPSDGARTKNPLAFSQKECMQLLVDFFQNTFPNTLNQTQIETFVLGLFNTCQQANEFSVHVSDFLKEVKVFGGAEEEWRAARDEAMRLQKQQEEAKRARVPGMLLQYQEIRRLDDDDDL